MKKKLLVNMLCFMAAGIFVTSPVFAAISGSPHDFSTETWNTAGTVCGVCHTPHGAKSGATVLWNHALSNPTYTLYSSDSFNGKVSIANPNSSSKACLSCHDGTVAVDQYGSRTTGDDFVTGNDNLTPNLSNDHPISFTYDTGLATTDGGLFDPSTTAVSVLGGKFISEAMLIGGNKVECSSCHDIHKTKGFSKDSSKMLLVTNEKSALCLTCHNK